MAFSLNRLGGGGGDPHFKDFSLLLGNLANNQTVFQLDETPSDPSDVVMLINLVPYTVPDFITVAGDVVTWGGAFDIDTSDLVRIVYFV